MILFFSTPSSTVLAVKTQQSLDAQNIEALKWLFGNAQLLSDNNTPVNVVEGTYVGPRREMITPWSTTAVEITQNMNINGIE